MIFSLQEYVTVLFLSALVATILGVYAWRQRGMPGALPFAILMWDAATWSIANALEMAGLSLSFKLIWANLQYVCYTTIPLLWLSLALYFTGRERLLTKGRVILLLTIPVLTNILVWTNSIHGLIRRDVHLDLDGPFTVIGKTYGPWFYVLYVFSYVLFLITIILLLNARRTKDVVYRGQATVLAICLVIPLVSNILYTTGLSPIKRHDISPAILSLVGIAIAWGLFRFRMFHILPVARDAVLNSINDAVVVLNNKKQLIAVNPKAQQLLGWVAPSVIGRDAIDIFKPWPELVNIMKVGRETSVEYTFPENSDQQGYYELTFSPLKDTFNRTIGHLITLHDITERKRIEEVLTKLSQTDPLTGLYNRRRFYELLEDEIARVRRYELPMSVVVLDLDGLKGINDRYGHHMGDEVLKEIADQLRSLRQNDISARIGGDEFALLLPSTNLPGAEQLAWRLYDQVRHIKLDKDLSVTISLGVAELESEDDGHGGSILARADLAMYRAKQNRLKCAVASKAL